MEEKKAGNENEQNNDLVHEEIVEETSVDFSGEEQAPEAAAEPENAAENGAAQTAEEAPRPNFLRTAVTAVVILLIFTVSYFAVSMFNKGGSEKPAPSPTPQTELKTASPSAAAENGESSGESSKNAAETPAQSDSGKAAVPKVKYTQKEAMEIAKKAAQKQFGNDAIVFPASEETPSEVEIGGEKRWCYMFGADSMSEFSNSGSMRGLYHFERNTGEIFDNQNGDMKKIN